MSAACDVAIVGAGPYGLSIAAHLVAAGVSFRIFGPPMETWRNHMPAGMLLKSDGFASNLSEPASVFTLKHYCKLHGITYDDTRVPVPLETFVEYGLAFQRRFASELDTRMVARIDRDGEGFILTLQDGELLTANRVVLAVGISHFANLPESLANMPAEFVTHSSAHRDLESNRGRQVVVIGAGASAVDLAALLHEAGASVTLVARRPAVVFHDPPPARGRSLAQRLRHPSSGLGPGWRSRLYTEVPGLFRHLPEELRLRIVRRHLGPAPGWPMKERVAGKIPMRMGVSDLAAEIKGGKVRLTFTNADGGCGEVVADHVVAATGYRVDVERLGLLHDDLRSRIRAVENTPVLSANFESSVPGLYFVGIAAANSFGPMMRFAFGAAYTARKLARHLAADERVTGAPATRQTEVATR